ncbi:MAG: hypothetical protein AAFU67_01985, partial [Bacteroidota bacterium]
MQILTVVTGIIFVLLLLSLLASTIMELISSFFSLRGRNLIKAMRNMLASDDENEIILEDFKRNSLYRHLTEAYGRRSRAEAPSYMSAETFQSILFDIILKGEPVENLKTKIDALPDADLRNVLNQLLRESGGQLDIFRHEVQNWYNNVMDRASGWYKRYTQKILVFVGMGIAVIFNADTVAMYERLSTNPEELQKVVALAEEFVQTRETVSEIRFGNRTAGTNNTTTVVVPDSSAQFGQQSGIVVPPTNTTPTIDRDDDQDYLDFQEKLEDMRSFIDSEIESVSSPLGLGWEGVDIRAMGAYGIITKFLGFILTA